MTNRKKDLVEIFGYAPDDQTPQVRTLWQLGSCPFVRGECIKFNHDKSLIYGTCSVTSAYGDMIICPNRLYADNYATIRRVAADAFGEHTKFYLFNEYIENRNSMDNCVVALGKNSGKEIRVGKALSMDWVLVLLNEGKLAEYTGIEVQSLDITGNYRDAWHAYRNFSPNPQNTKLPSSGHGLNWANVHKRLIPQLIRKGTVYASSDYVKRGMYFVLPDVVYTKFEELIGDIPLEVSAQRDTLTVFTYKLGPEVEHGAIREIVPVRTIRFKLEEFAVRFIKGPNLPSGRVLDQAIQKMFGFT